MPPVAYFAAAGVVVVIAVLAAAAVVVFGRDGHRTVAPMAPDVPVTGSVPSAYSQALSTSAFSAIAKRTADARPLTAGAVFGTKTITDADSKASLRLTASKLDSRCAVAVWGAGLAGQLQRGSCNQAARSMYADKHFSVMVTIFNLASADAADRVVATADPREGNGFPLPLTGSKPFGQSFSTARGVAMGHYAVITWVQRADGTGDEQDAALLSLLVTTGRPGAVLARAAGQSNSG